VGNITYARPSDNVAGSATITASADDAAYPAANLADLIASKPAKLTGTSGNWVFAFSAPQRVDLVALIHHNLTAGLDVKIQGNATNAWTSPTFSQAITIPAYQEDGFPVCPFLDLTGLSGYSTSGFQYWRLLINAANAAAVAIGDVVLAALKRTLEVNVSWGATEEEEHPLIEHVTDYGVSTIYDLGTKRRRFAGQTETTDAGLASLRSLYRDARGRARPWLLVPDPSVNEAWLVRFQETKQQRALVFLNANQLAFNVEEVSRGLAL
jgi:hypothetical protein